MVKIQHSPYIVFLGSSFCLVLAMMVIFNQILSFWISYIVAINVSTAIIYGYDKIFSGTRCLRVPEKILHGFALIGGSPSALISQNIFRHKTLKREFQKTYWFIVAIQMFLSIAILKY
jgi:uncharacterized membrane protein YsdA (DUF1294 family)